MNAWKWGFKNTYQRIKAWSRSKMQWMRRFEWEDSVWRERKRFFVESEVRKWKPDRALSIYRKTQLDGSGSYRDLLSTKSWQIWICRGSVENLLTAKVPRWIEILSRIYRPDRSFSMDQEAIETNSRKLDGSRLH